MLEFAFLTNRLRIQDLLQPDDVMPTITLEHRCALAAQMQADVIFAQHALISAGADARFLSNHRRRFVYADPQSYP